MADHFLMDARLKVVYGWGSVMRTEGVRSMLIVS